MRYTMVCLWAVVEIAFAGTALSAPPAAKPAGEGDIGRYELFQGTYTSFDLKRQQTSTQSGIFLLETKTGQVRRYVNRIDEDGRFTEAWVPTERR